MWFSKSPLHAFVAPTFTCMTPSCLAWRAETLWVMSLWELWRTLVRKWRTWRKVSNKTLLPAGMDNFHISSAHVWLIFQSAVFPGGPEWVPRSSQIPILNCKTLYSNHIEWVIPSEIILYYMLCFFMILLQLLLLFACKISTTKVNIISLQWCSIGM